MMLESVVYSDKYLTITCLFKKKKCKNKQKASLSRVGKEAGKLRTVQGNICIELKFHNFSSLQFEYLNNLSYMTHSKKYN